MESLFERFEELDGQRSAQAGVIEEVCALLTTHALIEEEIFYPAVRRQAKETRDLLDEAKVEHGTVKELVARLQQMQPSDDLYKATVTVLKEYVQHHVEEEESELFKRVKASGLDLDALGRRLEQRKLELLTAAASA